MYKSILVIIESSRMLIREVIGWYPVGLNIISRIRGYSSNVVCDHDLVIEAFPRSANTYISAIAMLAFKGKKIARHTHSIGQIKMAVKKEIPALIVVRNPKEAVLSNMIRFPLIPPSVFMFRYYVFYRYVLQNSNHIYVMDFKEVVECDVAEIISVIERLMGVKADFIPSKEAVIHKVEEMESEDSGAGIRETHVARPSVAREMMKVEIEGELSKLERQMEKIDKLYFQLLGSKNRF